MRIVYFLLGFVALAGVLITSSFVSSMAGVEYGKGGGGVPGDPVCAYHPALSCTQPGYNDASACEYGVYSDLPDSGGDFVWSCSNGQVNIECRAPKDIDSCGDQTSSGGKGPGGQYDLGDGDGSSGTDFVDLASQRCNNPITDIPLYRCGLAEQVNNFMTFNHHLSCLGIIESSATCDEADCTKSAPRRELIGMATRLRGINMSNEYTCKGLYKDVTGEPDWSCQILERARDYSLISAARENARPGRVMTRAEAFATLMKAICVDTDGVDASTYPDVRTEQWQRRVIWSAMRYGFTIRDEYTFEENRPMLMQELYTVASRVTQWARENGGCEFVETPECSNQ